MGYPFNVLNNKDVTVNPAGTTQSWSFHTTNNYMKIGYGPTLEFRMTRQFTICGEALYHRLDYTKTATVTDGSDTTTLTEQTRAIFWDIPVMLRWGNWTEGGFRSKLYLAGGAIVRKASNIGTSNQTTFPDGSTSSNSTPATVSAGTLPGTALGIGFRLVDDFNLKLSPELRYVRWMGATFASDSTRTRKNDLTLGVALTF